MKLPVDLVPRALTVGLVQNITVLPERNLLLYCHEQIQFLSCHTEKRYCFSSSLPYLMMKGERPPWETAHSPQLPGAYLCISASLYFTSSAGHAFQCILESLLSFHNCILLVPKIINYQCALFPFSQFQMSSQFTAPVLAVNP